MSGRAEVLSERYQSRWKAKPIYDNTIRLMIDPEAHLHKDLMNVRSSAAACINTIGNIARNKRDLLFFLNSFNLGVEDIISFPKGVTVGGLIYNDSGNVIFEWIGPKKSPIYEGRGKRGQYRTSIDAYILGVINGKVTQLLIEWKFTEAYNGRDQLQKFAGVYGNERLRRYSLCLAQLRKLHDFPFRMNDEGGFGLHDLGYEPYYQLLRMTLLAKLTTPLKFDNGSVNESIDIEDYRIVHLSHSQNERLNTLSKRHLSYSPGLRQHCGKSLHEVWKDSILCEDEATKFRYGYWNEAIGVISDGELRKYLTERYG